MPSDRITQVMFFGNATAAGVENDEQKSRILHDGHISRIHINWRGLAFQVQVSIAVLRKRGQHQIVPFDEGTKMFLYDDTLDMQVHVPVSAGDQVLVLRTNDDASASNTVPVVVFAEPDRPAP